MTTKSISSLVQIRFEPRSLLIAYHILPFTTMSEISHQNKIPFRFKIVLRLQLQHENNDAKFDT